MGSDTASELSSLPSDSPDVSTTATSLLDAESNFKTPKKPIVKRAQVNKRKRLESSDPSPKRPRRAAKSSAGSYLEPDDEVEPAVVFGSRKQPKTSPKKGKAKIKASPTKNKVEVASLSDASDQKTSLAETPKKKGSGHKTSTAPTSLSPREQEGIAESGTPKVKRKRKTKEEKEAEMIPLAPRTVGSKLLLGAHVSAAGGVQNSIMNSVHIGGNAFALFLKSQRKWANPPLLDEQCTSFIDNCKSHGYNATKYVLPHGSYLVNLAHTDVERTKQAYESFLDDLSRCQKLGIGLYNFHPGNSAGAKSREEAIAHLATQLNKAHANPATGQVVTLLETMATRGNTIGGTFEDLRDTIANVIKKDRVGVCLDTCHVFAAGYDISNIDSLSKTLDRFDSTVGLKYLRALHVNDSKAPLASNRDLHANIGTGFLGLRAFHALVNEPRLWGLPMVLETPIDAKDKDGKEVQDKSIWAQEIKLLESLVGMDCESEEFIKMEELLRAKGTAERERVGDQVKRRDEKAAKPPRKRGSKNKVEEEDAGVKSESDGS